MPDTNHYATHVEVDDDVIAPSVTGTGNEADRAAVLAIHQQWLRANVGLDIPAMRECFPAGDRFSMFNRNSYTYFGIDEVTRLWQWFRDTEVPPRMTQTDAILRLEVDGDTAWIVYEMTYARVAPVTSARHWEVLDGEVFGSKATEIYRRDDGAGRPVWKMWHFQSAPLQPLEFPRPAFDDTLRQRGLGGNPYGQPLVTTVSLVLPPESR